MLEEESEGSSQKEESTRQKSVSTWRHAGDSEGFMLPILTPVLLRNRPVSTRCETNVAEAEPSGAECRMARPQ